MAHLEVQRDDLTQALRTLRRVMKPTSHEKLVLTFENGQLVIACVGASTAIDASGRWTGSVTVSSRSLFSLGRPPSDSDPIRLEVQDGRLRIGKLSVPCKWNELKDPQIELPLNPPLLLLLSLARTYSATEIASQSGDVAKLIGSATRRANQIISDVHRSLAPFGIPKAAVTEFVQTYIPEHKREPGRSRLDANEKDGSDS